jgi:hypothetical protein
MVCLIFILSLAHLSFLPALLSLSLSLSFHTNITHSLTQIVGIDGIGKRALGEAVVEAAKQADQELDV